MSISSRIHDTVEEWQEEWKVRLSGWMSAWFGFGIEVFFDVLGKSAAPKLKPFIDQMEATGKVPPELQPLLDELKDPTGEASAMFANSAGSALIGGAVGKMVDAVLLPLAYEMNRITKNVILAPPQLLSLWHRDPKREKQLDLYLSWLGYNDEDIKYWKELSWFLPGPADLVRWQAKEVFEPEMIERYGLGDGFGALKHEDFRKAGVTEPQELNFWMAHWEHASFGQVIEMLHRGVLSLDKTMPAPPTTEEGWKARDAEGEKALFDWYGLVEIPPFWRARLTAMSWNVPTRVDVRRWWDMRTINEAELRNVYHRQGYHGEDLDNYVEWTKVYVALPDIIARVKNEWISRAEGKEELLALFTDKARGEELWETKFKKGETVSVAEGKSLTKTEIYKGVKKDVINWGEGIELLQDLGYDYDEADYILTINVEAQAGSPETFEAFKAITQKYKLAAGREGKPMSEELKKAAEDVVRLTGEVEAIEKSIEEEKRGLIEGEAIPEAATKRLKKLQVTKNRAISELERVKSEYNSALAEWRHGIS